MLKDDWKDIWESAECAKCRDYSAKMEGLCPLRHYTDRAEGEKTDEK
jgi:hypothetical protein